MQARSWRLIALAASAAAGSFLTQHAQAAQPVRLHSLLERLSRDGEFSGAVVIRQGPRILFARGYGSADPFSGRPFTPDTQVDSGSLAKPVTAAAVLLLARDGILKLDAPVQLYLAGYPHPQARIRHLLTHSAGLPDYELLEPLANKTNEDMLSEVQRKGLAPAFPPGTAFSYCNTCYNTLATLASRLSGTPYLEFARQRLALPPSVTIRPRSLSDWTGRAIGFKRGARGTPERADSYEGEAFYGSANLSISAHELALWGASWWSPPLARLRPLATQRARIGGSFSGLTLGNWYCARRGQRCHYLGHHEGFHHMLFWDAQKRISIAMVTNNSLSPALQQPLQRALVAFADGKPETGNREVARRLAGREVGAGPYRSRTGEHLLIRAGASGALSVTRGGIAYPAYPIGSGIRYVPGQDAYLSGRADGGVHWLSLYEDFTAMPRRNAG